MWTVFQLFSWPEHVHVGKMMAIGNLDYKPEKNVIQNIMDTVWKSCLVTAINDNL